MPADLSDLATATLIARGEGDLRPLHPGPPPGDRRHRPAQERRLHPVQRLCDRLGAGGPAGRPRREQAGGEPGDRRPGEPGLPGPQPRPVRPAPRSPSSGPRAGTRSWRRWSAAPRRSTRSWRSRVSPAGVEAMRAGLMALAEIKAETTSAGTAQRRPARRLRQFSPIFPVRDMAAALAHYTSLGFSTFGYEGGGDYGFANRDGVSLHLALDPDHDPGTTYLSVRDADALYEEWSQARDRRRHPPRRPHGVRAARGLPRRPGRQRDPVRVRARGVSRGRPDRRAVRREP